MRLHWSIIFGLLLVSFCHGIGAPNKKATSLLLQRRGQIGINDSLKRVKTQLIEIIAEYNRNGLEGDDLDALKRFQGMLNKLTDEEITNILKQLEDSNLLKGDKTKDSALLAFDTQKNVITELNTIYLEWQQEQIFRELSDRFMKLSNIQRINMRQAVKTAQTHNQIIPTNPSEEYKIDIRIQELDQTGISDEADALIKKLEALNKKLSRYIEPRPSLAIKIINTDLKPAIQGSVKDIQDYNLSNAALKERTSYIAMINIARILAPKRDDEEVIRQALRDVEQSIKEQQEILDDTNALDEVENPNPEELSQDQADLVDQTDFIRQDITELVPTAAQELGLSTDNQQEARAALSESTASPETAAETAAAEQQAALENFADAQAALEEALEAFGEGEGEGEGGTPKGGGMDDHDWDGHKELSDEEKEELRKDVEEAIRQGEIAAGKTGSGGMSGRVKELLKPRVDWLAVMREYLTMTCAGSDYSTWNKPNRKYISSGWYLPSGVSERAECVVFAPDASGSCFTDSYLTRFFTEAMRIIEVLKIKKVIILYWDTEVITPIEIYEDTTIANIIATTKPEGGGGTNPTCIPKYMKEHHINPNAVVVLTDGEIWNGQWGTWDWPVLWCIAKPHGGRAETAPVGQTVVVDL